MCEQYILQPTESSPGTGNSSSQTQRMAEWSGNTQAAGSMIFLPKKSKIAAKIKDCNQILRKLNL